MKGNIILVLTFVWSSHAFVLEQCEEGDTCISVAGLEGLAKKTKDCETLPVNYAMQYARNNHCGYSTSGPLICCELGTPISNQRFLLNSEKSKENCEKFGKRQDKPPFADNHIINGVKADVAEFPHFAAFGFDDDKSVHNFLCGGVLISESVCLFFALIFQTYIIKVSFTDFVLSAAHCFNKRSIQPTHVRLGKV